MKMTQIAKTSLALSLLTTGVSIVTTQSAKAEVASALKTEQTPKSNIQKQQHRLHQKQKQHNKHQA